MKTIEQAGIDFVRARDEWLAQREVHRRQLDTRPCTRIDKDDDEAKPCWKQPSRMDSRWRSFEHEWCEECQASYKFYSEVNRLARKRGAMQAVLTRLVRKLK